MLFIGKRLIECIIEGKKWPKSLPKVTDKQVAVALGELLIDQDVSYFIRCEKTEDQKGILRVIIFITMVLSDYYSINLYI